MVLKSALFWITEMVIMRQADTVDNEKQEPAALQLSSCPVHLDYRISKNRLSGHHTE